MGTQTCTYRLTQKNLVLSDQPDGNVITHLTYGLSQPTITWKPWTLIERSWTIPTESASTDCHHCCNKYPSHPIHSKSMMEFPKSQLGKIHLRHWTHMRRNSSMTGKPGNLWKTYPKLCKVEYTQGKRTKYIPCWNFQTTMLSII